MKYYRPEYDLKVIGRNLKRLRKAKGLSVEEVRELNYALNDKNGVLI